MHPQESIKPQIIISKLFIGNPPNICKIDKLNELNVKLANYGNCSEKKRLAMFIIYDNMLYW